MKKICSIFTVLIIVILLTGCFNRFDFIDNHNNNSNNNNNNNNRHVEPTPVDEVKKESNDIDTNLGYNLPLGIDTVKLMSSGKVIFVPNDRSIGMGDLTVANDVRDIYIFTFGNGGYRSILFVKNDNTVSAVNASSLIENKRIEVLDNLGGYTNVEYLESQADDYASSINVVLDNGEKHSLDEYLK